MKKIIVGLLFNALIALNAGILSNDPRLYRSLSSVEYAVFGTPDPNSEPGKAIKRICYVEVRHAANLQAASSEDDKFLNEFEKVFDDCYETSSTVGSIAAEIEAEHKKSTDEQSTVKIGILIWFIRKAIDEKDIDIDAITQYNMLSFYRSYPIILKTIMAAIDNDSATKAASYKDKPEHLQYPALIGGML